LFLIFGSRIGKIEDILQILSHANRNVKYKSLQNGIFKLAYRTSEKHWGSNINNLDLPLKTCRQGFNE
jgi:hypothetical protein